MTYVIISEIDCSDLINESKYGVPLSTCRRQSSDYQSSVISTEGLLDPIPLVIILRTVT